MPASGLKTPDRNAQRHSTPASSAFPRFRAYALCACFRMPSLPHEPLSHTAVSAFFKQLLIDWENRPAHVIHRMQHKYLHVCSSAEPLFQPDINPAFPILRHRTMPRMHLKFHPDFRYQKVISRKSCRRLSVNPSAGICPDRAVLRSIICKRRFLQRR